MSIEITSFPAKSREANREFLARRSNRLFENKSALGALGSLGIDEGLVQSFFLGLSQQYLDTKKVLHENALVAPIINEEGRPTNQSIYLNIPSVTINPADEDCWSKGNARTYYSDAYKDQQSIVICSNIKDLWGLWRLSGEMLQERETLFISSSNNEIFPEEWYQSEFWTRFEHIYVGYPNDIVGDERSLELARIIGQSVERLYLPKERGNNWSDYCWNRKGNIEEFRRFFHEAKVIGANFNSDSNETVPGRFGYQPIDIAGAFHNGYLYYPVRTLTNVLENYRDEYGKAVSQVSSRIEVVLIRSDQTIQTVSTVPAPRGTPLSERVLKLTDGTLIESRPKSSVHSTWSWNSIQKFCSGKAKTRSLGEILNDVKSFLKQSVWLPYLHDYDLLTLLVPITFAQAVFQSVPLILVTGSPGSGKTALGRAMVSICANASTVGQISAAAIARLIDETKGFVVFDDLESIGKRKGRDASGFTELIQALKLSYNKQTSWKSWTDVSRGMSVKRLNFYGVKMFNNTSGTDDILGSRVLKIYTRRIPKALQSKFAASDSWNSVVLNDLRDELHTWTFENVRLIDQTYRKLFSFLADRDSEIAAPLRVFGELAQDAGLYEGLQQALEFQNSTDLNSISPVELMKEAVKRLVLMGYTCLSPTHIALEMKSISSSRSYSLFEETRKWDNPMWIGRQLRIQGLVDTNSPLLRRFLFGKYLRLYPLKKASIAGLLPNNPDALVDQSKDPLDFCSDCAGCAYQNVDCPIMESRLEKK